MGGVVIRPVTDLAALRAIEDLQQRIWGMPDREVVPAHQLLGIAAAGGVVLGAFSPDGRLVGFCYGFLGQREGRRFLYSHMAGVAEGHRGGEIGFRLKQAQREAALVRGLDWMVWTFDPLQSGNAYFNLHRLGVEARRYFVDYYGEMPDDLNRGVESDRLEVDWFLRAPAVVRLMTEGAPAKTAAEEAPTALREAGDPPRPEAARLDLEATHLRLAVPADFTALRRQDRGLARAWRAASREVFQAYFARDYAAVDFVRAAPAGHYILKRTHAD